MQSREKLADHERRWHGTGYEIRFGSRRCRTDERMSMRRTPTVVVLLLAFAFGLSAGPHPCHAAREAPPMKPVAGHASCHGDPAPPKAPAKRSHDCCDPLKGGHAFCDQACQGPAVLGVAPALLAVQSFEELAARIQDRSVPTFVLSIDHVPLA